MTHQTESSSTGTAVLLGLLGGAALGALTVALTTPKTGRELRSSLRNAALRLRRGRPTEAEDVDTGTIDALFI